jgi:hypothetical protein
LKKLIQIWFPFCTRLIFLLLCHCMASIV